MTCEELSEVIRAFPSLTTLKFSGNEVRQVTNTLPSSIHTLDLSFNEIENLADVKLLAGMPILRNLSLRSCPLESLQMIQAFALILSRFSISQTASSISKS